MVGTILSDKRLVIAFYAVLACGAAAQVTTLYSNDRSREDAKMLAERVASVASGRDGELSSDEVVELAQALGYADKVDVRRPLEFVVETERLPWSSPFVLRGEYIDISVPPRRLEQYLDRLDSQAGADASLGR